MKNSSKILTALIAALLLLYSLVGCKTTTDNTQDLYTSNTSSQNIQQIEPIINFKFDQISLCETPSLSKYDTFSDCATEEFLVPGLNQYMVPQGMDYWKEKGWMIISGYFSESDYSTCSVLVAVDVKSGQMVGEYYLKNQDGSDYTGHAGGVAITENYIYIANAKTLFRIPLSSLENVNQCGEVLFDEAISVPSNASFCNYSGGVLWVGDFYLKDTYPTDDYSHLYNRDGNEYCAWIVGYKIEEGNPNDFYDSAFVADSFMTPDYILSITERIQGMTWLTDEDKIVLSQSYGRTNDSTLYFYENPMNGAAHDKVTLNGKEIPVWFLDSKVKSITMKALPMSEGLACASGKLYVLFESGASNYRLGGGKLPTDRVWNVDISKYS